MGGHTSGHMSGNVTMLRAARLPRWALAPDWPMERGRPALADIAIAGGRARVDYHAYYHMNVATEPMLTRFLQRVGQAMARFA